MNKEALMKNYTLIHAFFLSAIISTVSGCAQLEQSEPSLIYSETNGMSGFEIYKRTNGSCYQVDSELVRLIPIASEGSTIEVPVTHKSENDVICPKL
jgi:hypothetical protein